MKYIRSVKYLSFLITLLFACTPNTDQTIEQPKASDADSLKESLTANEPQGQEKVILFFGNSLTAGYGLDASESYPSLIQDKLDSLGYNYKIINAGLSGETTASGNNRVNWVLERQTVDIFVLELGANDGLRGIDPKETKKNLKEIIEKVRNTYPEVKIILAGMMVPPSMGEAYSNSFQQIFPQIAQEKNVKLIPFLLDRVAGETELNQADGVHPTAEGQKIMADNVWAVLKEVIEKEKPA